MEENSNNPCTKISTLIFMDLETTGLPFDVGKRNVHITEISLVAVDRNTFEVDRSFRILNKLSLCIRPRSVISPGAMNMTGLYNDILENQEQFDDSVPKLLEYFFRRLQSPICLLAHNGSKFDFPVLQAELRRINYSLGSNILCADTLVAFRSICLSAKLEENLRAVKDAEVEEKAPEQIKSTEADTLSEDDIDKLLSQDLESFANLGNASVSEYKEYSSLEEIFEIPQVEQRMGNVNTQSKTSMPSDEFLPQILNEQTPVKSVISSGSNEIVKKNTRKRKILDPTFTPKNFYKKKIPPVKPTSSFAKRSLFPEPMPCSSELTKITKFSLENLYKHFFNENPPQSHYAECDCISLSKVCQRINQEFLQWIDENSISFCNVDALW